MVHAGWKRGTTAPRELRAEQGQSCAADKSGILFISQQLRALMAAASDGHFWDKHSHSLHGTDKQAPSPTCVLSWCWCVQVLKGVTQHMLSSSPSPVSPPCCSGCSGCSLGLSSSASTPELVLYSHGACATLQVQAVFCWIILLL